MDNQNEPGCYENRLVAFIDVLGFKNKIESSNPQEIFDVLKYIKAWDSNGSNKLSMKEILYYASSQDNLSTTVGEKYDVKDKMNCTCFSDSIVMSVLVDDSNEKERFFTLVVILLYMGGKLLLENFPLRGGIALGNIVHTQNDIVMGPALIEAYKLEETANYPRIILSEELQKKLNIPHSLSSKSQDLFKDYIMEYNDGNYGFDQLQYFKTIREVELKYVSPKMKYQNEIFAIKNNIEEELKKNKDNPHVLIKYI